MSQQQVGTGAEVHMPELESMMTSLYRNRETENTDFGIQILFDSSIESDQEERILECCKQSAKSLGISLSRPSSSLSFTILKEETNVSFHGSLPQLKEFYFCLPKTLKAKKIQFDRSTCKISRNPAIKFRYCDKEGGDWIGPLFISLWNSNSSTRLLNLEALNTEPTCESKSSVYLLKEQNCSSSLFKLGFARTHYSLPPLNGSFSSIQNALTQQKLLSKDWLVEAKDRSYDHTITNLKFNHPSIISTQMTNNQDGDVSLVERCMETSSPIITFNSGSLNGSCDQSPSQSSIPLNISPERGIVVVTMRSENWCMYGAKELCNLFTNYGNIEFAISCKDGDGLFLCYYSKLGAEFAVSCLNDASLAGDRISVNQITLTMLQGYIASRTYTFFSPRKRFSSRGPGLPNKVNPLSRTLHITYHHDRDEGQLSEADICQALRHDGLIVRIKRENAPKKRNMWFVEFSDVETAMKVLMKQHNKLFMGGTLRISFTKTL